MVEPDPTEVQNDIDKACEMAVDEIACDRHNDGGDLVGNTQASDLEWLARNLFDASTLGASDVRTVEWLIGSEQWKELGLFRKSCFDGPQAFDQLSDEQRDAWIKLARIVMYVIPAFAERVGHRWMKQAKAIREVWQKTRDR